MTQNQISAAKNAEDARHNQEMEKLQYMQNRISAKHYQDSDTATKEHYERSDSATKAHYERSDQAAMISANASALNAQAAVTNAETNRKKYEMEYDIEYNWGGNFGYPTGMPLSAMERNAKLELDTLIQPIFEWWPELQQYTTDKDTGQLRPTTTREQAYGIDVHNSEARMLKEKAQKASTAKDVGSTISTILNGIFGKSGLVSGVQSIVE